MSSRDYSLAMFAGESRDPDKVLTRLKEILKIQANGIDPKEFGNGAKKSDYGRYRHVRQG